MLASSWDSLDASGNSTILRFIAGDDANRFTIGDVPPPIDPGASVDVTVTFDSAGDSAEFKAELMIISNSAVNPELTVLLSAVVDAPDGDSDGDGLTDEEEAGAGTDPFLADSDGDTLTDGAEVNEHKTNPSLADTDGDKFTDGTEIESGTESNDPASFPAGLLFTEFIGRPHGASPGVGSRSCLRCWIQVLRRSGGLRRRVSLGGSK